MKRLILYFAVMLLFGAVWWQRSIIQRAQRQNQTLRVAVRAEAKPESRTTAPDELHARKRELASLRNEVRQLRAQKADLEGLRSQNERLGVRIAALNQRHAAPTAEQGFLLNQNWSPAGFDSPEALFQTFFWALREQDYQTVLACITPQGIQEANLDEDPNQLERLARLGNVQGLRITQIQTNQTDALRVDVQSAVDGPAVTFSVRRIGNEWKVHRF